MPRSKKSKALKQKKNVLAGSGDYKTVLKTAAKAAVKQALSQGGALAGGMAAQHLGFERKRGAELGRSLGAKLSRLIGSGDYTMAGDTAVNSLIAGSTSDVNASFRTPGEGIRVRHREYLQDVVAGTANQFSVTTVPLNAGLSSAFPYLSNMAMNFEEYVVHGLVFEYVSTTSPYNTSSAMGSVILAMEYNPLAPAFTSKQQMENSDFAVSVRPDRNMMYGVECDEFNLNSYLTRYGSATPLQLYDVGLLNIGNYNTTAIAAGAVMGELWVSYDITLRRPRLSPARYGLLHANITTPVALVTGAGTPVINSYPAQFGLATNITIVPAAGTLAVSIADINQGDTLLVQLANEYGGSSANMVSSAIAGFANCAAGASVYPTAAAPSGNSSFGFIGSNQFGCLMATVLLNGASGTTASFSLNFTGVPAAAVTLYTSLIITNLGNGYGTAW